VGFAIISGVIETAQLVVHRPPAVWRDRVRAYRLLVDDEFCGKVHPGQTLAVTVPAGRHWAQARIDWSGSPRVEFEVPAGGEVHLVVEPAGNSLTALWQLFGTTTWLRLTKVP
jgi:hypothetical protein